MPHREAYEDSVNATDALRSYCGVYHSFLILDQVFSRYSEEDVSALGTGKTPGIDSRHTSTLEAGCQRINGRHRGDHIVDKSEVCDASEPLRRCHCKGAFEVAATRGSAAHSSLRCCRSGSDYEVGSSTELALPA